MHQVNCPQCGKAFQIEGESIGSEFQCDRCEAIFFVDLPEADDDAHAQPEPPVATGAAVAYAQRKEIDINEQAERFFGTSVEAAQACDHWRQLMPKVSSLYRPSEPFRSSGSLRFSSALSLRSRLECSYSRSSGSQPGSSRWVSEQSSNLLQG